MHENQVKELPRELLQIIVKHEQHLNMEREKSKRLLAA